MASWIETEPGTPAKNEAALALSPVVEQAAAENGVHLDRAFPGRRGRTRQLRRRVILHRVRRAIPLRRTGRASSGRPRARRLRRATASRAGPDGLAEPEPEPHPARQAAA